MEISQLLDNESVKSFFGACSEIMQHLAVLDSHVTTHEIDTAIGEKIKETQRKRDEFSSEKSKKPYNNIISNLHNCSSVLKELENEFDKYATHYESKKEQFGEEWQRSVDEIIKSHEEGLTSTKRILESIEDEEFREVARRIEAKYTVDVREPLIMMEGMNYLSKAKMLSIEGVACRTYKVVPKLLISKFVGVESGIDYKSLLYDIMKFIIDCSPLAPLGKPIAMIEFIAKCVKGDDLLKRMDEEITSREEFDAFLVAWLNYAEGCISIMRIRYASSE